MLAIQKRVLRNHFVSLLAALGVLCKYSGWTSNSFEESMPIDRDTEVPDRPGRDVSTACSTAPPTPGKRAMGGSA